MAIQPCPVVDRVFMELTDTLLACSESRSRGCFDCLLFDECNRRWNAVSDRAARRYLNENDKDWFLRWFNEAQNNLARMTNAQG